MTVESIEETEVATSEQAEGSETPDEGNLTMAEYAANLLKAQSEEEQPESPEEETEPSEEAEESEELEETQSTEEPEESEQSESNDPQSVLLKYNIDLDSLSEEETKELAKSLSLSAVKRFGDLTAQKKAWRRRMPSYWRKPKQSPNPCKSRVLRSSRTMHSTT